MLSFHTIFIDCLTLLCLPLYLFLLVGSKLATTKFPIKVNSGIEPYVKKINHLSAKTLLCSFHRLDICYNFLTELSLYIKCVSQVSTFPLGFYGHHNTV